MTSTVAAVAADFRGAAMWSVARLVRQRVRLLRHLRLAGPRAWALAALYLVRAALPTANAVAAGLLVARLLARETAAMAVAGLAALLLVTQLVEVVAGLLERRCVQVIDGWMRHRVRVIAAAPAGAEHLDCADFLDDATRAADQGFSADIGRARSAGAAAVGQLTLMSRLLSGLMAAALVARLSPVTAVALVVLTLAARSLVRRQWVHLVETMDASAGRQRRLYYWSELAAVGAPLELRMFGLAPWVLGRQRAATVRAVAPLWRALDAVLRRQWLTFLLVALAAAVALGGPGLSAVRGALGFREFVTVVLAAQVVLALCSMGYEAYDIEYGAAAIAAADRLEARYGGARTEPRAPAANVEPEAPPLVRFEDVVFAYPGTGRRVLDGLTLTIHPGETLAVVGPNGTGKTTFVKLLAALYRPDAGRITVDGTDLADLDLAAWRSRMTAVFTDFVRYPATLADNVAFSAPAAMDDADGIVAALRRAGAGDLLTELPQGVRTSLWRQGANGADLSGGQWQRVAIARALFARGHGRRFLVFDEPTANLDVRAEAAFHEQVVAAVAGASTVLISHRMSTVRPADRIVLLRDGRVAEEGDHDSLVRLGGEYARSFRLQSARFGGARP